MNKNNLIKIILDIIMTVVFLSLMSINITGMNIHELLGLGILALFIFHNVLNWAFTKNITKRILKPVLKTRVKVMYFIDIVLLLLVILMAGSGVLISKTILTSITTNNTAFWTNVHISSAYLALILISIHVGMHWTSIMGGFRKMFKIKGKNLFRKVILTVMSIMLVTNGLITFVKDDILKKILLPLFGSNNSIDNQYKHNGTNEKNNQQFNNEDNNRPFNKGNRPGSSDSENNTEINIDDMSFSDNYTSRKGRGNYSNRHDNDFNSDNSSIDTNDEGLQNYLGSLNCTACGKHCPLTSPQCGRGMQQAQQAMQEYSSNNLSESQNKGNNSDSSDNNNIDTQKPDSNQNNNSLEDNNNNNSSIAESDDEGLQNYLGSLNCTACGRNCPLNNPQCSRGVQQAQEATLQYNNQSSSGSISSEAKDASDFTNIINLLSVMSVFIAGTHYVLKFNNSIAKNNKNI